MNLSPMSDKPGERLPGQPAKSMDTSQSQSYVSLTLDEIKERFQELMEEEQLGLTLEEPDAVTSRTPDDFNPYNRC